MKTPVWFAAEPSVKLDSNDARLYVYTIGVSGKVKRIRSNPRVNVAPCDIRGGLKGDWVPARAEILTGEEATRHAVAEQEVCSLETTAGFFRRVPQARAHCFCDSPKLIRAFFEQGAKKRSVAIPQDRCGSGRMIPHFYIIMYPDPQVLITSHGKPKLVC